MRESMSSHPPTHAAPLLLAGSLMLSTHPPSNPQLPPSPYPYTLSTFNKLYTDMPPFFKGDSPDPEIAVYTS